MNRIQQSFALAVVLSWMTVTAWTGHSHGAVPERPNVVLIMTDNHGAWTLDCYGNRDIRTPHIDRLAREGTLFSQ